MEPMGSITNYFRFAGEDDQRLLEGLLEEATKYTHYVELLGKRLLSIDASDTLVFICARLTFPSQQFDVLNQLAKKHSNVLIAQPFFAYARVNTKDEEWKYFDASAEKVLKSHPDDWIAFQIHFLRLISSLSESSGSKEEMDSLNAMESLLETNDELDFLRSFPLYFRSGQARREGDLDKAVELRKKSVELALEHDDIVMAIPVLRELIPMIMNDDPAKALGMLKRLYDYYPSTGLLPKDCSYFQHTKAALHLIRGELDIAVESYERALELCEKLNLSYRTIPHELAQTHMLRGDAASALEWTRLALKVKPGVDPRAIPYTHLLMSSALSKLDHMEEAADHLEKGKELLLKVGSETLLVNEYLATAHLDIANDDLPSAMVSLERAFRVAERLKFQEYINSSLLSLVACEIALLDPLTRVGMSSGVWMDRLERETHEKDMPGITGLLLLQKARLSIKRRVTEEAHELLDEIARMAQLPGLSFLHEKADLLLSTSEL